MKRKFPLLCSPIQIGNVTLRNRMASAPTGGTDFTQHSGIGRRSIAFYELKAKGGAAVVTVSEVVVHPETDASGNFHLDATTPGLLGGFSYAADAIRRHGAIPSVELSHGGRYGALWSGTPKYGPSPVNDPDEPEVYELSVDQINDIIDSYGQTAALAKRAGFEMIMIHGGHGWLINQFLSLRHNKRTDEYGGSLENRCRFAVEAIESIRKAVGPGFPIEFRISGRESIDGGYGLETAVEIAKIVEPHIDLLHISAGSHHIDFTVSHPSAFTPHGVNVPLAAEIKKHVKVPVAIVGALGDPAKMEEILEAGQADVIYMARSLIADPYLPWKVVENRDDEVLTCLRCFTCNFERGKTTTRRCALNPVIGREIEGFDVQPAAKSRKVLVAGGGPAGMEAALIAAQRGHKTVLCEKTGRLGGILNCEEGVPFKEAMFAYPRTMERLLKKEGVEIRLNTTVTAGYVENENADVLICAIGSEPLLPPLPGIDNKNTILVQDLHSRGGEVGKKTAILGGGLAGCEAALQLADRGVGVVLIEMQNDLMSDANELYRDAILVRIEGRVDIKLGYTGSRITDEGIYCTNPDGAEELISADTIIIAAGQRARRAEVNALLDAAPRVYQIGDCVTAKDITTAVYQGYHAALDV